VQIAPYGKNVPERGFAEVRQAQFRTCLEVPQTAMVVTTDLGDEKDIHPKGKDVVGARLALAARAVAYGERIEYSGPVYDRLDVEGDKAVLSFKHVGGGLLAKGGPLRSYTIAGPDGKYVHAEAEIRGDRVVVWSWEGRRPTTVRFGWADYPLTNLWNKDGRPASPFRADDSPPK
jgi:sialate O-acetylesterase